MDYMFLIQVDEQYRQILFDFQFQLIEKIRTHYFFTNKKEYQISFLTIDELNDFQKEDDKRYIPIGSMQFVDKYIELYEGRNISEDIQVIYIPDELQKEEYLKRKLEFFVSDGKPVLFDDYKFCKSLKHYKDVVDVSKVFNVDIGKRFVVSDLVDIVSEYRCFIFDKRLIDIANYNGDKFIIPNKEMINQMINDYKSSPDAYTLDIGVLSTGETIILEVHPMVSCGLYGVDLGNYYLPMLIRGYNHYLKN